MRNFIILTGIDDMDVSVDINDIVSMSGESRSYGREHYTAVYYGDKGDIYNVKESVKEIVRRINEVNNNQRIK